ncbi:MAG: hypothetical protein QM688_05425 [Sphingomonas bacterium]
MRWPARQRRLRRQRHRAHRLADPVELHLSRRHAVQHVRQRIAHAAQGGIGGERPQHRLRGDQRGGGVAHVLTGAEQQPLAREEIAAVGAGDAAEMRLVLSQPRRQPRRAVLRQLRRVAIDDQQHPVAQLRESGLHRPLLLAPVDIGGDQRGGVGGHREAARDDEQRRRRQHQRDQDRPPWPADAGRDDCGNGGTHRQLFAGGPLAPRK